MNTIQIPQSIKFNKQHPEFIQELRARIDAYLTSNKLSKTGGSSIFGKALIMFAIYLVPFVILLTIPLPGLIQLSICVLIGIGIAGVGMCVMHDANHGSFSNIPLVNKIFGASLYLLGGNVYGWKIQHNTQHHTYTNILHHDDDITAKPFLRLSTSDTLKTYHKYQFLYAPILYSLMNFTFYIKDFKMVFSLIETNKSAFLKEFGILIASKAFYFLLILGLPMMVMDITMGEWFIGYLITQLTAGFILALVFQLAHIVEGLEFPESDDSGNMENNWAIHQMKTTANFAKKSKLLAWYIGGLNYQIEHHLFPTISHIHYPKISDIVQQTASEYGVPYHSNSTFFTAIISHIKMLKKLGTSTTSYLHAGL